MILLSFSSERGYETWIQKNKNWTYHSLRVSSPFEKDRKPRPDSKDHSVKNHETTKGEFRFKIFDLLSNNLRAQSKNVKRFYKPGTLYHLPKRYGSRSRNTHKQHSINSLEYTKYRALSLTYPQFSTPHLVLDPISQPNFFPFSKSKRKKTSLTRNSSSFYILKLYYSSFVLLTSAFQTTRQ